MTPSPDSSAASNRVFIFFVCSRKSRSCRHSRSEFHRFVRMAKICTVASETRSEALPKSFCRIMTLSSDEATLNVSCINTALIMPTAANPTTNLYATLKIAKYSLHGFFLKGPAHKLTISRSLSLSLSTEIAYVQTRGGLQAHAHKRLG